MPTIKGLRHLRIRELKKYQQIKSGKGKIVVVN